MKKILKSKQGFLQISFPWLFAMIVGALILFLAIYGVTRLISTEETIQSVKASKELGILLNPLETGFEEAKTTSLSFPVETRIYNKCNSLGNFGRQLIQISQLSMGKWTETDLGADADVGFSNKYIFSNSVVEGKTMLIFSKPFEFPFKTADLIYITSEKDKYCFIDAPDDIQEEIGNLGQANLLVNKEDDCEEDEDAVMVCFSSRSTECPITVNYDEEYLNKRGSRMNFKGDALMYAAIFSEAEVYDCQLRRLMKRVANLALLYKDKSELIDCGFDPDLITLINSANALQSSAEIKSIGLLVDLIDARNSQNSLCRLW